MRWRWRMLVVSIIAVMSAWAGAARAQCAEELRRNLIINIGDPIDLQLARAWACREDFDAFTARWRRAAPSQYYFAGGTRSLTRTHYEAWRTGACGPLSDRDQEDRLTYLSIYAANDAAYRRFRSCVSAPIGLSCWAEPTDDGPIVMVNWRPLPGQEARVSRLEFKGASPRDPAALDIGTTLGTEGAQVALVQRPGEPALLDLTVAAPGGEQNCRVFVPAIEDEVMLPDRPDLAAAAAAGDEATVRRALEIGGVDPNQPDKEGRTPLWLAVDRGNLAVIDALLGDEATDPNMPNRTRERVSDAMQWPLHLAARNCATAIVDRLLDAGARADLRGETGAPDVASPSAEELARASLSLHRSEACRATLALLTRG